MNQAVAIILVIGTVRSALILKVTPNSCKINELNPDRAADLRQQGFTVTEQDAITFLPDQLHDVVMANPPFGRVKGENIKGSIINLEHLYSQFLLIE